MLMSFTANAITHLLPAASTTYFMQAKKTKTGQPYGQPIGSPAVLDSRPVAFRPLLAKGLALSYNIDVD